MKMWIKAGILALTAALMVGNTMTVMAKTYETEESVINEIRKNLLERDKEFTINTTSDIGYEISSNENDFVKKAIAIDKKTTSKDADYLANSYKDYRWSIQISGSSATVTFQVNYYLSATKESEVDKKVKSVLNKLDIEDKSDYKKVKAIHDYIINLAKYDQTYAKYTAYDIFVNKSAVCQGYTLAAYRLFTDAGIKCKIITGYANGANHAWNIVKVNGKWYNIDLTWDDPLTSTGKQVLRYDYFLKNDSTFSDHLRDQEFATKEFIEKYPISEKNY